MLRYIKTKRHVANFHGTKQTELLRHNAPHPELFLFLCMLVLNTTLNEKINKLSNSQFTVGKQDNLTWLETIIRRIHNQHQQQQFYSYTQKVKLNNAKNTNNNLGKTLL